MLSVDEKVDISVATWFAKRKQRDEWLGLLSRAIEDDVGGPAGEGSPADADEKLGTIAGVLSVFLRDFHSDDHCAQAFETALNYLKEAEISEYYNGVLVAWYFDDMQSGNSEFFEAKALNAVMRRHYDQALHKFQKHYQGQEYAIRKGFGFPAGQQLNLEDYLEYDAEQMSAGIEDTFDEAGHAEASDEYDASKAFEKSQREKRREERPEEQDNGDMDSGGMFPDYELTEDDFECGGEDGLELAGPPLGTDPHDGDIYFVNETDTVIPALERYGDVEIRRLNPSDFIRKFPYFSP